MPSLLPPAYAKRLSDARAQGIRITHLMLAWSLEITLQALALCLCVLIQTNTQESCHPTAKPVGISVPDNHAPVEEAGHSHPITPARPPTPTPPSEKEPVIPVDEVPPALAAPVVEQPVTPQPPEAEPVVPVDDVPQVSAGALVKQQQITHDARPWRQEILGAIDILQELVRNGTEDSDVEMIWIQVESILVLLEAPNASDIDNREISPAASALLVKTLLSDNVHRCNVQVLDLMVRCITVDITWTPEHQPALGPALKTAIQGHLRELGSGSTSSYHREAALDYHSRLVALGCNSGDLDVPQLLAAYDLFRANEYD